MNLRTVEPQAKYGLIKKSNVPSQKKKIFTTNVKGFSNDDDDENDDISEIRNMNRQLKTQNTIKDERIKKLHEEALAYDENAFDYDGVYDSFKKDAINSHPLSGSTSNKPVNIIIFGHMIPLIYYHYNSESSLC